MRLVYVSSRCKLKSCGLKFALVHRNRVLRRLSLAEAVRLHKSVIDALSARIEAEVPK